MLRWRGAQEANIRADAILRIISFHAMYGSFGTRTIGKRPPSTSEISATIPKAETFSFGPSFPGT